MAYILVSGLRRVGLKGTELAQAQVCTIRTKLLKIGAQIRVSVRKVWVSMASGYPWQDLYQQVWLNLRCGDVHSGIRHLQFAVSRDARLALVRRYCPVIAPQTAESICDRNALPKSNPSFFVRPENRGDTPLSAPLFPTPGDSVRNPG
jgi:hypothetical protein